MTMLLADIINERKKWLNECSQIRVKTHQDSFAPGLSEGFDTSTNLGCRCPAVFRYDLLDARGANLWA